MEKLKNIVRSFKLPKKSEVKSAFYSFSKKEKIIFIGLALVLFICTIAILENINKSFMVAVPARGGSLSEGIIGTPRFASPVLAISDADKDLVSLVYSGLMRKNPDGELIPDLAENYTISPDGLTYTFTLKNKIYFQDGKPVTANDVVFTINEIKDPVIKSPLKGNWDGINVEKIDDQTVKFTLKQPYSSFLENATVGIMPESLWSGSPLELNSANTNPIGSGPFKVLNVNKQSSGIIDSYTLSSFNKFALGNPYLGKIILHFYSNEDDMISALRNGTVDQVSSITPANAEILREENYQIDSAVLPRVFGLFFNQNQAKIFTDKNVVKAINLAINKDNIIKQVLAGYGVVINDPIPPNMMAYQKLSETNNASYEENVAQAKNILAKDGWKMGADGFLTKNTTSTKKITVKGKTTTKTTTITGSSDLGFSISTGNTPEIAESANLIAQDLAKIGIKVDVKTFEIGDLNQIVIRPRKYDALLFGEIINHESDLFAFWHSSQRKDPGLNVAMYANAKVDKLLEDASITINDKARVLKYAQFENQIEQDMPAVFLYSPDFIYVVSKNLEGLSTDHIVSTSDRFSNSYLWYTETNDVWKIFVK